MKDQVNGDANNGNQPRSAGGYTPEGRRAYTQRDLHNNPPPSDGKNGVNPLLKPNHNPTFKGSLALKATKKAGDQNGGNLNAKVLFNLKLELVGNTTPQIKRQGRTTSPTSSPPYHQSNVLPKPN
jgi:hypothetical protein